MNDDPNVPPPYQPPPAPVVPQSVATSPTPAPRPRRGLKVYAIVVTLLFAVLLGIGAMWFVFDGLSFFEPTVPLQREFYKRPYQELVIGGDLSSDNKIAVIYLNGIISYEQLTDAFGRAAGSDPEGMVGEIKSQLKQAVEDRDVKAILIRMDTPGGEVTAADDLYHEVLQAKGKKPVVVSMASLAASGGYYVAAAADHIVASETTLTGSIGVIIQTITFEEAFKKIGVKPVVFKSGKHKDMLSFTHEPSEESAKLIQDLVQADYERFLDVVVQGRRNRMQGSEEAIKGKLRSGPADGRILLGKQAKGDGLVDAIGYFDNAVTDAKQIGKVKDAKLITYFRQVSLRDLLGISLTAPKQPAKVEFSIISAQQFRLQPGRRYYLHEAYALP